MCINVKNKIIDFDQDNRQVESNLYKYYNSKNYNIASFAKGELFFARPAVFNDSFDTSAKLITPFDKFKTLIGWNEEKELGLNSHGICSFIESDSVKNGRMWAFYANNYDGFAIEYDKVALLNKYDMMRPLPVMYLEKPLDLDNLNLRLNIQGQSFYINDIESDYHRLSDRLFQCLHLVKQKQLWEDECEWRMIIGNHCCPEKFYQSNSCS